MKLKTVAVGLLVVLAVKMSLGAPPSISVSGIMKSGDQFSAYIDDRIYTVDQEVAGCRIVSIDNNGITVESSADGQLYYCAHGKNAGVLLAEKSEGESPAVENDSTVTIIRQSNPDPENAHANMPEPMAFILILVLVNLAASLLMLISTWRIYSKAGEHGWASIIPIYNVFVLLRIADKPGWWILLLMIPCVNIVISVLVYIGLAESFGRGVGFALGLILFPVIFLPILAFSRDPRERNAALEEDRTILKV